ncbi:MAG: KilA-N domain-containing protein [Bacteroidetes bacterium]|nr:KilA-N domain-containing protein [Bacteroidota bacterium]
MAKKGKKSLIVQDTIISWREINDHDYISLTDMAKKFNDRSEIILQRWMRNRNTVEFLILWEEFHNSNFNHTHLGVIRENLGLDTYVLSIKRWTEMTNAIGIQSKTGRYGGTFAHRDIAFEFATWLSPAFKFYLIKEFERLKSEEAKKLDQIWDYQRFLTKVNYRLHTDTIKEHILPTLQTPKNREWLIYANEADLLNMAVFGQTAKEWRETNPEKAQNGNIRDYADIIQLNVLANLESLNSVLIERGVSKEKRFGLLAETAISQYKKLSEQESLKRLE